MSVRLGTILLGATLLTSVGPSLARAQSPANGGRCDGTLCDLYYGNNPPPPAAAAPAPASNGQVPLAVPSSNFLGKFFSGGGTPNQPAAAGTAPATSNSLVKMQGGGLVGGVAGAPQPTRCSGTLCDVYYGGAAPQPVEQVVKPAGATAAATPEPAADETAPVRPSRRVVEEKPRCVAPANDPWRCYR